MERQAAFSGLNWFETAIKAAVCVWLWVLRFTVSILQSSRLWAAPLRVHERKKMSGLACKSLACKALGWGLQPCIQGAVKLLQWHPFSCLG